MGKTTEISHKPRERIYIVGFDTKEAYDLFEPRGNQADNDLE